MQLTNKTELKLENFEKCSLLCDNNCSLGSLWDFACALQAYVSQRMKEAEPKKEEPKVEEIKQEG